MARSRERQKTPNIRSDDASGVSREVARGRPTPRRSHHQALSCEHELTRQWHQSHHAEGRYICTESEGAKIFFRNIRVMELPPE
jgi:hypothetical protein